MEPDQLEISVFLRMNFDKWNEEKISKIWIENGKSKQIWIVFGNCLRIFILFF